MELPIHRIPRRLSDEQPTSAEAGSTYCTRGGYIQGVFRHTSMKAQMLQNVHEDLNAGYKGVFIQSVFCEMYPTCVSSKLCEFIFTGPPLKFKFKYGKP